ncbi:isochorismatase family protein [bacterium]|nr:isochorismatase family protein [bacterium]
MNHTALLVVDVQESFRHRPYWSATDLPEFAGHLQKLIDGCAAARVPVLQILHTEDKGAFALSTGFVRTLEPVKIEPEIVIHKRYHSALAGTPLTGWLNERHIHRLVICGIRTEECCETTTRHASDYGFEVDFVMNATMTFPVTFSRTGRVFSSAELKERTELVLTSGQFARVATVEEALAKL